MHLIQSLAGILATLAAFPLIAHAQPACGSWESIGGIAAGEIRDLVAFDDGSGPQLYMAGEFLLVQDPVLGTIEARRLARWDGTSWSTVPGIQGPGNELDSRASELEVWDDGSGPALYVVGAFRLAAGLVTNGLVRWDGTDWSVLGDPATAGLIGTKGAITAHDFGDGERLFIGGDVFLPSSPRDTPKVWSWDGASWAPVDGAPEDGGVITLASLGGELFASVTPAVRQGDSASNVLRFDGTDWTIPVGTGQRIVSNEIWPLLPWSIGGRDVLIAAGNFTIEQGGEAVARNVAAWNGSRWDPLPGIGSSGFFERPASMASFDDGTGDALFIGSTSLREPKRWKDGKFGPVFGLDRTVVLAMTVFDDGDGETLYLADSQSRQVYRWKPAGPCAIDLTNDCTVDLFDFLAFQNLFDAGDPAADFDDDGRLTLFDFLAYQNAFGDGCP
ncbi:MAG: hypothetical protein HRU13_13125 [Phycisphaerales bacterium]|nr:hypothetical protein [Phycisphaerales bacterium]